MVLSYPRVAIAKQFYTEGGETMKKNICFLITLLLIGCASGPSNTLEENKVDEFTGHKIKRTHYQVISISNSYSQPYMFCRFSKIDDDYFLDLKLELPSGHAPIIEKNALLMIKLKSGSIVELKNLKFNLPCNGCGSTGFSNVVGVMTSFPISESNLQMLSTDVPVKVRAYMEGGYVETDVKEDNGNKISEIARLVL